MTKEEVKEYKANQKVLNSDEILQLLNLVKDGIITPELANEAINIEDKIDVPDIRNKLSPVTHLICLLESDHDGMKELIPDAIISVKRIVNYLAKREVYKK